MDPPAFKFIVEEFGKMAQALENGDLKNYPKVDPAASKSIVEEEPG